MKQLKYCPICNRSNHSEYIIMSYYIHVYNRVFILSKCAPEC